MSPLSSFPPKLKKEDQSHGKASVLPNAELARNLIFWDATLRKKLAAPRYSKVELDARRAEVSRFHMPRTEANAHESSSCPVVGSSLGQQMIAFPLC